MKKYIVLLSVLFVLASCKSGKLTKADPISESETVIIGEFKILNSGKDITKNSKIYFDENQKGILSYKLGEGGLLIMKVPKGSHFIKLVYTPFGSVNLPVGYANIAVPENGVHYIGTITIDAEGQLARKFQGAIYDTSPKWQQEKKVKITVADTPEKATKAYQDEFGTNKPIVKALLTVEE